jgi:hypothetical protein
LCLPHKLAYGSVVYLLFVLVANGTIACQGAAFEYPDNGKHVIFLQIEVLVANIFLILLTSRIFYLLQVILRSEVKASLHVKDMWLDLQSGFEHLGKGDGRPASNLFPLVIAPSSRAGILFIIRLSDTIKFTFIATCVPCNGLLPVLLFFYDIG